MENDVKYQITALFEKHAESIYLYASFILPRHIDAKDVVQEVFLKAYQSWGTYRHGANERAWLYRIAKNHIIDVLRKYQSDKRKEEYLLQHSPITTELGSMLEYEEILLELSPKYREVLILRIIEKLSVEETAKILGCTSTTVRVRLHRALKTMQNLMYDDQSSIEHVKG